MDKMEGHGNRGHRIAVANRHHPDGTFEPNGEQLAAYEPKTEAARQWSGWGTALKPALEPITMARKPLVGTVAANVLKWHTGGINVDGCRVAGESTRRANTAEMGYHGGNLASEYQTGSDAGRWPANLIHDGSDEVVDLLGDAARFFYCAKTSKKDRNEGLDNMPDKEWRNEGAAIPERANRPFMPSKNNHPTVKPTDLMRWLVRLVTPPGGVVLDPFMGSGSTGKAAMLEGFEFIGIEREAEYVKIAKARIDAARVLL
jgi:site-specific DNA-methyltransferase (adenine-specific)